MNSSKAHMISFREALSRCPYTAFLSGVWSLSFLLYTCAVFGGGFSQNSYAFIAALLFFLNVIWFSIRAPNDEVDRHTNNFFFGFAFYTGANGILGRFDWMNYNSRTMLFEFMVITFFSYLIVSSYRRVNV